MTGCSHHFHLGCIYEWMERSESCPICGKVPLNVACIQLLFLHFRFFNTKFLSLLLFLIYWVMVNHLKNSIFVAIRRWNSVKAFERCWPWSSMWNPWGTCIELPRLPVNKIHPKMLWLMLGVEAVSCACRCCPVSLQLTASMPLPVYSCSILFSFQCKVTFKHNCDCNLKKCLINLHQASSLLVCKVHFEIVCRLQFTTWGLSNWCW